MIMMEIGKQVPIEQWYIKLFKKTLSKEKQKAHKSRLQGNKGIFETNKQ